MQVLLGPTAHQGPTGPAGSGGMIESALIGSIQASFPSNQSSVVLANPSITIANNMNRAKLTFTCFFLSTVVYGIGTGVTMQWGDL